MPKALREVVAMRGILCSKSCTLTLIATLITITLAPTEAMGCTSKPQRMNVCELFAGIAIMSAVLQSIGWHISMLCEQNPILAEYLKIKFPEADVQLEVEEKPWIQWAKDGLTAHTVVAGVPCQPFSAIGQLQMQNDKRAFMALHVCDAAVALKSSVIILEEVSNFVDLDDTHGVFTEVKRYYKENGFSLEQIIRPHHSECGGWTNRERVIIFFTKQGCKLDIKMTKLAPQNPPELKPDTTRNWLDYGTITGSGCHFQYDEDTLVPGATVYIYGDRRLMRIQSTTDKSMTLRVRDTKSRCRPFSVPLQRLQSTFNRDNRIKFIWQGMTHNSMPVISQTIRAWGEEPGRGGPLMWWKGGVYTATVCTCARLNEVEDSDLEIMEQLKFTEAQKRSAIGNCVVDSMVRGPFIQMKEQLYPTPPTSTPSKRSHDMLTADGETRSAGTTRYYSVSEHKGLATLSEAETRGRVYKCIYCTDYGTPQPYSVVLEHEKHCVNNTKSAKDLMDWVQHTDEPVYFYSETDTSTGYLSQWYLCIIKDDDNMTYISAEQYMMAAKAKVHKEMSTHESIMMASSQAEIKQLGRMMPNYDEQMWSSIRPAVLRAGNKLKFGQNPQLMTKLLATGQAYIAEASAQDAICGIGISVTDAQGGMPHKGDNLLGKALMQVRTELLQGAPILPGKPDNADSYQTALNNAFPKKAKLQQTTNAEPTVQAQPKPEVKGDCKGDCKTHDVLCNYGYCYECCFNNECSCSEKHPHPNQLDGNAPKAVEMPTIKSAREGKPKQTKQDMQVLLLPINTKRGTVYLSHHGEPLSATHKHAATGTITKHAQSLAPGKRVYFIGRCLYETGKAWVTATLKAEATGDAQREYNLKQLVGTKAHRPTLLAMAKFGSMISGHTTLGQMRPLMNATGEFEVGALCARVIKPELIAQDSKHSTRTEALLACRAAEEQTRKALTDAAKVADSERVSNYLCEWAQATTETSLRDIPDGLLAQIPKLDSPALATMLFSCTGNMPRTNSFTPPTQKRTNYKPKDISDIKHQNKITDRETFLKDLLIYYRLSRQPKVTNRQLVASRPEADVCCVGDYYDEAQGIVWDLRGHKPVPLDFSVPVTTHINVDLWKDYMEKLGIDTVDKQLVVMVMEGVCTLNNMAHQTTNASPLISLAEGITSITSEIARLVELGYLLEYDSQPFEPIICNPQGARIKADGSTWRRISDNGFPQGIMIDSDLVNVIAANVATKLTLNLPHELKVTYKDTARDICVLRHIGDQLGWVLKEWCDDLKDWFYQLKQHCSEYHKSCFIFHDPVSDKLKWYVETVMGMGYVHTSNISQRFTNSIIHIFIYEFNKADKQFLDKERRTNKVLDDYLKRRSDLVTNNQFGEARLASVHGYTDDIKGMILEPPGHSRLAVMLTVWCELCHRLGIRTAAPCKRIIGSTNRYLGVISIAVLAIQVLPQDKVMKLLAGLCVAASGHQAFSEYQKLVGLLGFTQYALGLERSTMNICYEPMAEGCANGPRSKVVANTRRKQAWTQWAERLIKSNGAPCNNAIDQIPSTLPSAVHVFVWYGDAAIKGTSRPAMGAYSHSLYWVFYLSGRHTKHLHISALEFLTIIGQLIIFGNKMPMPSGTCKYQILIQSDSLNATMDLTEEARKSPIMQYIHERMLQRQEYQRLKHVLQAGHIWGEGNSITDDLSRGDLQLAIDTCTMLGVKPKELPVPSTFTQLVNDCVEKAISLGASKRQ